MNVPFFYTPPDLKTFPDVVADYRASRPLRTALVFCVHCDHARSIAEAFNAAGVPADTLLGSDPPAWRALKIRKLNTRELLVLCVVSAWEQTDLQAESVILLRPTHSRAMYAGMVRRATVSVRDYAGNIGRFGLDEPFKRKSP